MARTARHLVMRYGDRRQFGIHIKVSGRCFPSTYAEQYAKHKTALRRKTMQCRDTIQYNVIQNTATQNTMQ